MKLPFKVCQSDMEHPVKSGSLLYKSALRPYLSVQTVHHTLGNKVIRIQLQNHRKCSNLTFGCSNLL